MITLTTKLEAVHIAPAAYLTAVSQSMAHSIMEALADRFSAKIMTFATEEARTVEEISSAQGIPLSTCYRRIQELVDEGLVLVERIVITESGKRYATYRSCFRSFRISADRHGVVVEAELNEDVMEKIRNRRLSISYAGHFEGMA
ncbi:MAG: winged helix-turn-helix domain-containing protein [Thaumarchaeota archaeon]|nr:winged helix-turn-helix domain-containing protein [Nitrososphaerota archaeon]